MKKSALLLLLLSGCASSENHQFAATCYGKGFEYGTEEYITCINDEHTRFVQVQTEYR